MVESKIQTKNATAKFRWAKKGVDERKGIEKNWLILKKTSTFEFKSKKYLALKLFQFQEHLMIGIFSL